jgi:hypothetical protein
MIGGMVDLWKCCQKNTLFYFLTDQALHIAVMMITWQLFYCTGSASQRHLIALFHNNHCWLLVLGYLTVTGPLGIAIGKATEKWQKLANRYEGGLYKAGIWIG